MNLLQKIMLISLLMANTLASGAKVKSVDFSDSGKDEYEFSITMEEGFRGIPQLEVRNNILQVSIPESQVWPKIDKEITISKKFDTKLMAYQFNKDLVRFRAVLPKSLTGKESLISLAMEGDRINVKVPKKLLIKKSFKKTALKSPKKPDVNKYDESYLEKLFQDKLAVVEPTRKTATKTEKKTEVVPDVFKQEAKAEVKDQVALQSSSLAQTKENEFSMAGYIGKFVAFLALILVGFYFVISLMKKGVLKKGKLGFLNNTKVVEVLNTTYIGPKRSISVIKAHNQVFLIGNSEKGIHFLSEINDVSGLLKNGELDLAGSNFDTNMNTEKDSEKSFNLKEILTESAPVTREESSVKNQITAKLKNLKSLQ